MLFPNAVQHSGQKPCCARTGADGGAGTEALAKQVVEVVESGTASFKPLYDDSLSLWEKVETVAREIYRADGVDAPAAVRKQFDELQADYGNFPVCMAKTQYSFSSDPSLKGAPSGHRLTVREVRLSAGAGFIVVVCGEIMTIARPTA